MRYILNFLIALDRLSGLMLKPAILLLLVEVIAILLNIKGFDISYACNQLS